MQQLISVYFLFGLLSGALAQHSLEDNVSADDNGGSFVEISGSPQDDVRTRGKLEDLFVSIRPGHLDGVDAKEGDDDSDDHVDNIAKRRLRFAKRRLRFNKRHPRFLDTSEATDDSEDFGMSKRRLRFAKRRLRFNKRGRLFDKRRLRLHRRGYDPIHLVDRSPRLRLYPENRRSRLLEKRSVDTGASHQPSGEGLRHAEEMMSESQGAESRRKRAVVGLDSLTSGMPVDNLSSDFSMDDLLKFLNHMVDTAHRVEREVEVEDPQQNEPRLAKRIDLSINNALRLITDMIYEKMQRERQSELEDLRRRLRIAGKRSVDAGVDNRQSEASLQGVEANEETGGQRINSRRKRAVLELDSLNSEMPLETLASEISIEKIIALLRNNINSEILGEGQEEFQQAEPRLAKRIDLSINNALRLITDMIYERMQREREAELEDLRRRLRIAG